MRILNQMIAGLTALTLSAGLLCTPETLPKLLYDIAPMTANAAAEKHIAANVTFPADTDNPSYADCYTDSHGWMAYSMQKHDLYDRYDSDYVFAGQNTYDIAGKFDEKWKKVTFRKVTDSREVESTGFSTFLRIDEETFGVNNVSQTYSGSFIPVSGGSVSNLGLQTAMDYSFSGDGTLLYVTYKVKNTTSNAVTFSLGSCADVQIGEDDDAQIVRLDNGDGLLLKSENSDDMGLDNDYAQFNFFSKDNGNTEKRLTSVDNLWFGSFDTYKNNKEACAFLNADGVDSYRYSDSAMAFSWTNKAISAGAEKTFTVAFRVGGVGSEVLSTTTTTDPITVVAPVTNLKNVSGNAITFTKSPDATRYYIYKNGEKVATTCNTSFAFQTLTAGKSYDIGVVAVDAKGNQSIMTSISFTAVSMLPKPTGLVVDGNTLSWNHVSGAACYKVYAINVKNNYKYVATVSNITQNSYAFKSLKNDGVYQLRVCAVDVNGVLGHRATTPEYTYHKATVAPVSYLRNVSGNAITWKQSADAVSYNIYKNGALVANTKNASFSFQTLTVGKEYRMGVAAVNANGAQSKMVYVSYTAVPVLVAPIGLKRDSLTLSWRAVNGAKRYKVYAVELDKNGSTRNVITTTVTGTSYAFDKTKFTKGKSYVLRVCAVDKNGSLGNYATTKKFAM